MSAWSFRNDIVAGLYSQLQAFQVANPTLLANVFRSQPKTFSDRPLAFVASRNEALQHSVGLHRRTVTPSVVIVYQSRDYSDEMADIQDDIVDLYLEYSSGRPHAISSSTLVEPRTTEDVELELDGAFYPATVVTFLAVEQKGAQTGL